MLAPPERPPARPGAGRRRSGAGAGAHGDRQVRPRPSSQRDGRTASPACWSTDRPVRPRDGGAPGRRPPRAPRRRRRRSRAVPDGADAEDIPAARRAAPDRRRAFTCDRGSGLRPAAQRSRADPVRRLGRGPGAGAGGRARELLRDRRQLPGDGAPAQPAGRDPRPGGAHRDVVQPPHHREPGAGAQLPTAAPQPAAASEAAGDARERTELRRASLRQLQQARGNLRGRKP